MNIPITHIKTKRLIEGVAKNYSSKIQIKYKKDSLFMRFIGGIVGIFNKSFMDEYITTIGTTIYVPDNFWKRSDNNCLEILSHELVHIYDYLNNPLLFGFNYLKPQVYSALSLLSILSVWNRWCLLFLLFLVWLLPFPSAARAEYELRGYTMTMAVVYWLYGKEYISRDNILSYITTQFTSSTYYYMWPNAVEITGKLNFFLSKIESGEILNICSHSDENKPYFDVYQLIQAYK